MLSIQIIIKKYASCVARYVIWDRERGDDADGEDGHGACPHGHIARDGKNNIVQMTRFCPLSRC